MWTQLYLRPHPPVSAGCTMLSAVCFQSCWSVSRTDVSFSNLENVWHLDFLQRGTAMCARRSLGWAKFGAVLASPDFVFLGLCSSRRDLNGQPFSSNTQIVGFLFLLGDNRLGLTLFHFAFQTKKAYHFI